MLTPHRTFWPLNSGPDDSIGSAPRLWTLSRRLWSSLGHSKFHSAGVASSSPRFSASSWRLSKRIVAGYGPSRRQLAEQEIGPILFFRHDNCRRLAGGIVVQLQHDGLCIPERLAMDHIH